MTSENTTAILGDFQKDGAIDLNCAFGVVKIHGNPRQLIEDTWPERSENDAYIEAISGLAAEIFEKFGTIEKLEVKLPR